MQLMTYSVKTEGEVRIVNKDWEEQTDMFLEEIQKLDVGIINNIAEYQQAKKMQKDIKKCQDDILHKVQKIDSPEILKFKTALGKIKSTLAKQKTAIRKSQEEFKQKEQSKIIQACFGGIKSYPQYPAQFTEFVKLCEPRFKGQSDFGTMLTLASDAAEDYQNKLENLQLKFDRDEIIRKVEEEKQQKLQKEKMRIEIQEEEAKKRRLEEEEARKRRLEEEEEARKRRLEEEEAKKEEVKKEEVISESEEQTNILTPEAKLDIEQIEKIYQYIIKFKFFTRTSKIRIDVILLELGQLKSILQKGDRSCSEK